MKCQLDKNVRKISKGQESGNITIKLIHTDINFTKKHFKI